MATSPSTALSYREACLRIYLEFFASLTQHHPGSGPAERQTLLNHVLQIPNGQQHAEVQPRVLPRETSAGGRYFTNLKHFF